MYCINTVDSRSCVCVCVGAGSKLRWWQGDHRLYLKICQGASPPALKIGFMTLYSCCNTLCITLHLNCACIYAGEETWDNWCLYTISRPFPHYRATMLSLRGRRNFATVSVTFNFNLCGLFFRSFPSSQTRKFEFPFNSQAPASFNDSYLCEECLKSHCSWECTVDREWRVSILTIVICTLWCLQRGRVSRDIRARWSAAVCNMLGIAPHPYFALQMWLSGARSKAVNTGCIPPCILLHRLHAKDGDFLNLSSLNR